MHFVGLLWKTLNAIPREELQICVHSSMATRGWPLYDDDDDDGDGDDDDKKIPAYNMYKRRYFRDSLFMLSLLLLLLLLLSFIDIHTI